jgi:hypothetical protein
MIPHDDGAKPDFAIERLHQYQLEKGAWRTMHQCIEVVTPLYFPLRLMKKHSRAVMALVDAWHIATLTISTNRIRRKQKYFDKLFMLAEPQRGR